MKKLVVLLLFLNPVVKAQSLEPGLWKAKTTFKVGDLSLPPSEDEECISTAEAKDAKGTITKELKRNGCKLLTWKVTGSQLEVSLTCTNEQIDAKGTLRGHFSAKNYELNGDAEGTYQGVIPATATLKLTGQWAKACAKK